MESQPSTPRRTRQEQIVETRQTVAQETTGQTFATPEELLRFDAAQTPPPPALEQRLRESVNAEPPRKRSWWARLFGG